MHCYSKNIHMDEKFASVSYTSDRTNAQFELKAWKELEPQRRLVLLVELGDYTGSMLLVCASKMLL